MHTDDAPQKSPPLQPGARKGMRKGTHSCYECRRRKIRCIFANDSTICESCDAKGRSCTEQRRELLQKAALDNRETLRERVARLEAILQASKTEGGNAADSASSQPELRDGIGTHSSSPSIVGNQTPGSSPNASVSLDKASPSNIDPIVTLFDNAIWRRHSSDSVQGRVSKAERARNPATSTKRTRTRELLLSGFLPTELVAMILSATCSWWHTWRPLGPWLSASIGDKHTSTLQDFVLWAFNSADPSIIGLGVLCIAVCLQQLDTRVHEYIIRQLPALPGELFQEYFEKVDHLILNDPDYASTEEGIEVAALSAKTYMNLGLNRKCWVYFHRAISYSQLLGFHRPERLSADETEAERYVRIQSWLSLCSADVYASLLLGLPYAADGRTIPLTHSQRSRTSLLQHNLILLSAKVIDRNQMGLSLSASHTEEIEKGVEAATQDLDETFWNSPAALASGKITREEHLEQIACQCWLHHVQVLLHMPLMIHSVEDIQLEKHRIACLEASRKLLKIYHIMRSDTFSAFNMVKLIDYQAFVCSALLILGLLGYGGATRQSEPQDKDRDLIGLTISTLRQASGTVNNPMASQAVEGLETLMFLDQADCANHAPGTCVNPHAKIVVPQPGSTSPSTHPLPVFALSHDTMQGDPGGFDQNFVPAASTEFDGVQASGQAYDDNMLSELPSVDFDWSSTMAPSFGDDWAWLNDMNY